MTEFWIVAGIVAGLSLLTLMLVFFVFPRVGYLAAIRLERLLAGLRTRSVEVDGILYTYNVGGKGAPLLLLHGFTADKDNWTRTARYLTGQFRVIAPDLAGFGESTSDPALDYSIESQVARLARLVEKLGLEKFHLGGSSMGGAIAAVYAGSHPQQVLSLWLLAPGGVVTVAASEMQQILANGQAHPLIPGNLREFEATLNFVFSRRPLLPAPMRRYLAGVAASRQALYRQIFDDLLDDNETAMTPTLNSIAATLKLPVLVIWGEQDRVLHPSGATALGEMLDNDTIELIPGMGHLPMLEAPKATALRFLEFQRALG